MGSNLISRILILKVYMRLFAMTGRVIDKGKQSLFGQRDFLYPITCLIVGSNLSV